MKELKINKGILFCAFVTFLASFMPWIVSSYSTIVVNGVMIQGNWNGGWYGPALFSSIAALLFIILWLLPKFNVDLKNIEESYFLIQKILSTLMVVGPILWFIGSQNNIFYLGVGFYVTVISGIIAVLFSFTQKEPTTSTISSGDNNQESDSSKN